jgi:hypothetical protein
LLFLRSKKLRNRAIGKQTDIVIEGFPRSANSFAVAAFRLFGKGGRKPVKVAHHLHAPAQIILAARYGIPCVVLIRRPLDAVLSLMVYRPSLSAYRALRSYLYFYKKILPYREAFVIGSFEEVTSDFSIVIERINRRFGTEYSQFEHNETNTEKIFARIKNVNQTNKNGIENYIALPTLKKEEMKALIRDSLKNNELEPLVMEAEKLYLEYTRNL